MVVPDEKLGERRPENYLKCCIRRAELSYSIACDGTRTRTRKKAIEYEYRFTEYEYERKVCMIGGNASE